MSDGKLILPNALAPQISQAMWLVGRHPAFAVAWGGNPGVHETYTTDWPDEGTIRIFRHGSYDNPCMIFFNIHSPGLGDINWTPEEILSDGNESHDLAIQGDSTEAELPAGASISKHFSYTFAKTQSLLDATQNTIKEELSARLGGSSQPVGAGVQLDVTQQYTKTFGTSETESTTVGDDLTLTGPGTFKVEASRGIRKARRRVNAPVKGDWGIAAFYYGHQMTIGGLADFNDMISGRAPDNVGVLPDTLGGAYNPSFSAWVRSIGQLGSPVDPKLYNLDQLVQYITTYDTKIQVKKS